MTGGREFDAERHAPVMQKSREEAKPDSHRCGGCNSCHGMTRIHGQGGLSGWGGEGVSGVELRRPCATGFFQRNLGNSSFQALAGGSLVRMHGASGRIQRKCSCGGSCESCAGKEEETGKVRAKLAVGAADDPYEEEADRVAASVMRMPDPLPQRGADESGQAMTVRRVAVSDDGQALPGAGIDLDSSGGERLSSSTRGFMEPRFGADFAGVRLHRDENAQRSAAQIRARAFTYGSHIWLGKGESEEDRGLMAHELTHVMQQGGSASLPLAIRRSVVVNPDTTAADDILDQFNFICPQVNFSRSGRTIVCDQSSIASKGCECLSDVASDSSRTYTINVDTVSDIPLIATLHDGSVAILPNPSSGPRTYGGTNPVVHVPASSGSAMEFGAFSPSGSAIWCPNWRILGHELCGHGRLNQDCEEKGNRPSHNSTIDTENTIAAEHGEPARGHFRDRRQGESFHNPVGDQSRVVFKLVNGWHYEAP